MADERCLRRDCSVDETLKERIVISRLVLSLTLVTSVQAQTPQSAPYIVRGVVFDSVARAPLAGAVVQVVQVVLVDPASRTAASESAPRVFAGTADASGHFRIQGLPAGRFAIGFQHDALNALGLESPLRGFELGNDTSVTVDLAIPGGPAVHTQLCGGATRLAGEGVLVGYILDARGENTLKGAVVRAHWLELALERGNYRTVTRTVTSVVGDDGRYVACGLTSDESVAVDVMMPGHRGIANRFVVPVSGTVRQDFRLADSGVVRGSASLVGRAVLADGTALAAGRAEIAALALVVPVLHGDFSVTALPPGTWVVEVRAIGYEPKTMLVHVSEAASATAAITLDERAQVLNAVAVKGRPGGAEKILSAIASRRSVSVGTVFLPGNDWLESAYDPADVVRGAPGFRYVNPEVLLSSGCGFKYPPLDETVVVSGPTKARTRTLAVYLNGSRVGGGLAELRTAVSMGEILAVEAYQDIFAAPLEWRTNDACAVLSIWTKR